MMQPVEMDQMTKQLDGETVVADKFEQARWSLINFMSLQIDQNVDFQLCKQLDILSKTDLKYQFNRVIRYFRSSD